MMASIMAVRDGQRVRILCWHWRSFPPGPAYLDDPEGMWKKGLVKQTDFQQYLVWKKVCGKKKMEQGCLDCGMVRIMEMRNHLPVMVSLDGLIVTPTTDIQTMEASPRNRVNCLRQIRGIGRKEEDKDDGHK